MSQFYAVVQAHSSIQWCWFRIMQRDGVLCSLQCNHLQSAITQKVDLTTGHLVKLETRHPNCTHSLSNVTHGDCHWLPQELAPYKSQHSSVEDMTGITWLWTIPQVHLSNPVSSHRRWVSTKLLERLFEPEAPTCVPSLHPSCWFILCLKDLSTWRYEAPSPPVPDRQHLSCTGEFTSTVHVVVWVLHSFTVCRFVFLTPFLSLFFLILVSLSLPDSLHRTQTTNSGEMLRLVKAKIKNSKNCQAKGSCVIAIEKCLKFFFFFLPISRFKFSWRLRSPLFRLCHKPPCLEVTVWSWYDKPSLSAHREGIYPQ